MHDAEIAVFVTRSPFQINQLTCFSPPTGWMAWFYVNSPGGEHLRSDNMFIWGDFDPNDVLSYTHERNEVLGNFVEELMEAGWTLCLTSRKGEPWPEMGRNWYSVRLTCPSEAGPS